MSQPEIRLLTGVDYAVLEDFLRPHTATSMFLRSNARAAGLDDHGDMFQASYLGAFDGAELVGVIAHCWNGMILMHVSNRHMELASVVAGIADANGLVTWVNDGSADEDEVNYKFSSTVCAVARNDE